MSLKEELEVEPGLLASASDGQVRLVGGRCKACGAYALRALSVCPECWAEDTLEKVELSPRGRVVSSFTARTAPPGFKPPYAFALIDLPEGLRVLMRITNGQLSIGDEVELERGELGESEAGVSLVGPVFRPVGRRANA